MITRIAVAVLCLGSPLCSQSFTKVFGGSASDRVSAVTTDAAGNIYAAGTTRSLEFPVTANAFQARNRGTQLVYSPDAGATWQPLGNILPARTGFPEFIPIAVDPRNPDVIYAGGADRVYRSIDHGLHLTPGDLLPAPVTTQTILTGVSAITVDPFQPTTMYAARGYTSLFKSVDSGRTWRSASAGIPSNSSVDSIRADPFHQGVLYALISGQGFRSTDGAASWSRVVLPIPEGDRISGNGIGFIFDPLQSGVIYAPSPSGIFRTTDNGQTWIILATPFSGYFALVLDPKTKGTLYANVSNGSLATINGIWKSTDGGKTWNQLHSGFFGALSISPADSHVLIAGNLRSVDAGATFQPLSISRQITSVFAPSGNGAVYGSGTDTSDAFVMKLNSAGDKVLWATYFGGQDTDSATSIALDRLGNVFIAGTTSSNDLPVTAGALQHTLSGSSDAFLAKFTADGSLLYSTYLGGSLDDAGNSLAVDSGGNALVAGLSRTGIAQLPSGFVTKVDTVRGLRQYSFSLDGTDYNGIASIAVDSSDNALITGSTNSPAFPLTDGVLHGPVPSQAAGKVYVVKLDPAGKTIYSTYFGGTTIADPRQYATRDIGVAIASDRQGNAYVTGNTAASDFPVTAGAFQQKIKAICPYPAFSVATGLIGTIYTYLGDDVFITKLSPDGKQMLFSTLLGGQCYDRPTAIAVDDSGIVSLTGETNSGDFPVTSLLGAPGGSAAYQSFVSRLSADGGSLLYSAYLNAGSSPSLALDASGKLLLGGAIGPGSQTFGISGFVNPFPDRSTRNLIQRIDPSAPRGISLDAVRNAFSLRAAPIVPGEILSLSVSGLEPAIPADIGLNLLAPLTTSLAETEVLFDGKPGNLISVMRGRVVCLVPAEDASRIEVRFRSALSNAFITDRTSSDLGLLSADGSGIGPANVRNSDGSLNSKTNPAAAGSVVTLFATGLGADKGAALSASFGPALSVTPLEGFAPGIYAIRVVTPAAVNGTVSITLSDTGSSSQTMYFFVAER